MQGSQDTDTDADTDNHQLDDFVAEVRPSADSTGADDAREPVEWVDLEHPGECPRCGSEAIEQPAKDYSLGLKSGTARCSECDWIDMMGADMATIALNHPDRKLQEIKAAAYRARDFGPR